MRLLLPLSVFAALAMSCSGCAPPVDGEGEGEGTAAEGEGAAGEGESGEGEGASGEGEGAAGEGEGAAGEGEGAAGEGEGEGEGEGGGEGEGAGEGEGEGAGEGEGEGEGALSFGDIPNLTLWLKADALVANDGDAVSDWPDSSGLGFDALETNATQTPIFHANALAGQPAVTFDGVDDTLVVDNFSLFTDSAGGLTIVVVFQANDIANQRFLMTFPQNNCDNQFELGYHTGDGRSSNFGVHAGCSIAAVTTSDIDNNFRAIVTRVLPTGARPDNVQEFFEGTQQSMVSDENGWTDPGNYPATAANMDIGSRDVEGDGYHDGDIAEIIVFGRALDDTELTSLNAYVSAKYGL